MVRVKQLGRCESGTAGLTHPGQSSNVTTRSGHNTTQTWEGSREVPGVGGCGGAHADLHCRREVPVCLCPVTCTQEAATLHVTINTADLHKERNSQENKSHHKSFVFSLLLPSNMNDCFSTSTHLYAGTLQLWS